MCKIDEDDDDDDDEGDSNTGNISPKNNNGTKRDDSRRRAAHTAAEQKRRNAIRVNNLRNIFSQIYLNFFSRKDMIHYKVLYQIVIYLIQLVHKKLVKQQYLNDVRVKTDISFKKQSLSFSDGLSCTIK